jgi:hypothetical protein
VLGALPTANMQSPTTMNSITITPNDLIGYESGWRGFSRSGVETGSS